MYYNNFIKQVLIDINNEYKNVLSKLKDKGYEIVKTIYDNSITYTNGNIPIKEELLNKYTTVSEIFENEGGKNITNIYITTDIVELKRINIKNIKEKEVKLIAKNIFKRYFNTNTFVNDNNRIIVSFSGIEESIQKMFELPNQKLLMKEILSLFIKIDKIIENARLVSQTLEYKNRLGINYWNYYFCEVDIDGNNYYLEFEVRSMNNGQNQFRIQRIKKVDVSTRIASN